MRQLLYILVVILSLSASADKNIDYSITNRVWSYGTVEETGNSYSTIRIVSPVEASHVITNGSAIFKYDYRVDWIIVGATAPSSVYSSDQYEMIFNGINSNDARMVICPISQDEDDYAYFWGNIKVPNILADDSGHCEVRWCWNSSPRWSGAVKLGPDTFGSVDSVSVPKGWEFPIVSYESAIGYLTIGGTWSQPGIPIAAKGEVVIPSVIDEMKVTRLSSHTMHNVGGVTNVVIPDTVLNICSLAFYGCSGLKTILVPRRVTSIQEYAFGACNSLTNILVNSQNRFYTTVDGVLYDKAVSRLICVPAGRRGRFDIPDSVASIADGAFFGCIEIPLVKIPSGVEEIGDNVFCGCCLTSIVIPSSVTRISELAFNGAYSNLEVVYIDYGDSKRVAAMLEAAGMDISRTAFVEGGYTPLPELVNPTPSQVSSVLSVAGDEMLVEEIVDGEEYANFCDWASTVKDSNSELVGYAGVMASKYAWLSYSLDSDVLLESGLIDEDLTIEKFNPSVTEGKFDILVSVKDVEVGSNAVSANLKKVLGVVGSEGLVQSAFTSEAVDVEATAPYEGKIRVTVGPTNLGQRTFFMKVGVREFHRRDASYQNQNGPSPSVP